MDVTHEMSVPGGVTGECDWRRLPAGAGVVIFEGQGGVTLLAGTTGSVREFARRRLAEAGAPGEGVEEPSGKPARSRRMDWRAVTTRVLAVAVGSAFEAEVEYLRQVRARLPREYRAVAEKWRAWWVRVDPEAPFPEWRKTNLAAAEGVRARRAGGGRQRSSKAAQPQVGEEESRARADGEAGAPGGGVLIGPVADKDAAGRLIEGLIDLFDLCRYQHILVQSPRGMACAYKEMGRCPAPCDGSETLESYRARVRAAVEFAAGLADGSARRLAEAQMRHAADRADFEETQRRRKFLERMAALEKPALASVSTMDRFRWLIVMPSEQRGWARLFVCVGGRLVTLADVRDDVGAGALDEVLLSVRRAAEIVPVAASTVEEVETLGLVSRWLGGRARGKRGAGEFVPLPALDQGRPDAPALARSIRSVVRRGAKGQEAGVVEQEMEGLGEDQSNKATEQQRSN